MQKIKSIKLSRKKLIIIAAALVIVAVFVGAGFWLKALAETGAKASIEKSHTDVTGAIKTLNTKLVDPKLAVKDRIVAFSQLDEKLGQIDGDTCSAEAKNIAFVISSAKKSCRDAHAAVLAIRTATQKIEQNVKDDQALSAVLTPIQSADAADATKQLEAWTMVATNISKVKVSTDATNLKSHLLTVASSYKTAWQELVNADKAQNKVNYNASVKKLDAAKDELAKVAQDQTSAFKNSLAEFKQSVSAFK